jgi:hypothetical protein
MLKYGPDAILDSKTFTVNVTIPKNNSRVKIAIYDITMQLNKCGSITVTATGSLTVQTFK